MSEEASLNRKEKKARRDAERKKGTQKRKREERTTQKTPQDDNHPSPSDNADPKACAPSTQPISTSSDKCADSVSSHRKKRKKTSHVPTEADADQAPTAKASTTDPNSSTTARAPRFILFIGNLPYTTTDAALHAHFRAIAPFTLRHRTDATTGRSKGFAFLEFEGYDRMKTCLRLYHHSVLDIAGKGETKGEGEGKCKKAKANARRINVELTAGGGGAKAEGRREKIRVKNGRLNEQRVRRLEAERREKAKLREGEKGGGDEGAGEAKAEAESATDHHAGVHPARRARLGR